MGVKEVGERYKCNVCGNIVEVIEVGGGTLVCCGKNMQQIKNIAKALLERRGEEEELEEEELKEMVEEIKGEPEEEEEEW